MMARIGGQTLTGIHNDKVAIQIRRGLYVAVRDLPEVDAVNIALGNVIGFIKDTVVPRFEPFFERHLPSVSFACK